MLFVGSFWRVARTKGWTYITPDTRNMYVDGAKTLITAAGIAVALLASSGVAEVSLIACVAFSLAVILIR